MSWAYWVLLLARNCCCFAGAAERVTRHFDFSWIEMIWVE
jgi:hypothetical protein